MSEARMDAVTPRPDKPERVEKFEDLKPDLERQALLRREIASTRAQMDGLKSKLARLQTELEQAERVFTERAKKVAEGM